MQVDKVTVEYFTNMYAEVLSRDLGEIEATMVSVRDLGEALSYMAMCVIAQSGIDEGDAPLLLQELGLGMINGAFEAGKLLPIPWNRCLDSEQAEFLEAATGVLTHDDH